MAGDAQSMIKALAQVTLAGAATVSGEARRHLEMYLGHGESLADNLLGIARDPNRERGGAWDRVVDAMMSEYRDYVRELAAAPTLATISFFEQLERLRTPPKHEEGEKRA
jgi:hypothetical protein